MTVQNLKFFQLLLHNLQHAEGSQYFVVHCSNVK